MNSVQVSELRERLDEVVEAVKTGKSIAIFEGYKLIGTMQPEESDEERLARLERKGIITRGTGLSSDFFSQPAVDLGEGALAQFLEDRRNDR